MNKLNLGSRGWGAEGQVSTSPNFISSFEFLFHGDAFCRFWWIWQIPEAWIGVNQWSSHFLCLWSECIVFVCLTLNMMEHKAKVVMCIKHNTTRPDREKNTVHFIFGNCWWKGGGGLNTESGRISDILSEVQGIWHFMLPSPLNS